MPRRPRQRSPKYAGWMFTENNPTMEGDEYLKTFEQNVDILYCVFQLEIGERGTPHYQGYVEFKNRKMLSYLKNHISNTAHWERRRGNRQQAHDYCTKEETRQEGPWSCGEIDLSVKQGTRTELKAAVTTATTTLDITAVSKEHPMEFVKYHRGFRELIKLQQPKRVNTPKVTLFYGPTGTGKTRKAYELFPDLFKKIGDTNWYDGYQGHKHLLIDDFAGKASKVSLTWCLQLFDRYPIDLPVKGSFEHCLAEHIIVTTNIHPKLWYDYSKREEHYRALKRRFTGVFYFASIDEEPYQVNADAFWDDWYESCDESSTFTEITQEMSD